MNRRGSASDRQGPDEPAFRIRIRRAGGAGLEPQVSSTEAAEERVGRQVVLDLVHARQGSHPIAAFVPEDVAAREERWLLEVVAHRDRAQVEGQDRVSDSQRKAGEAQRLIAGT